MHTRQTDHALDEEAVLRDGSLSRALAQGLDTPLAALRASVESLSQEFGHGHRSAQPRQRMDGVLREVERLGRNVRELCDFASPPVPRPLACTLEEIIAAATQALTSEQRSRVVAAHFERGVTLRVDGPLLSGCLRRILENALEATDGPVLVVVRPEEGQTSFTVIDEAPSSLGPDWQPAPFQTTKPNHLGLGLALTQRDIALLNGRLEFPSSPGGETCVRIAIPSKEDVR